MKTRAISAVVMLAIFVPLLVLGGTWFDIAVFVLAFLALKEFILKDKSSLWGPTEVEPVIRSFFLEA